MRATLAIGVASEILLVAGILFVIYGVSIGIKYYPTYCPYALCIPGLNDISPYFYMGIALLVSSSIGFLFALWSYRRTLTTKGGTAS